jgi:hypothetical protein
MTSRAQNDTPIVYHLDQGVPTIEQVTLNLYTKPYFVYLNKKNKVAKML